MDFDKLAEYSVDKYCSSYSGGQMVNGSRCYTALESVSIASALSSELPFTHARSEYINADSLKL